MEEDEGDEATRKEKKKIRDTIVPLCNATGKVQTPVVIARLQTNPEERRFLVAENKKDSDKVEPRRVPRDSTTCDRRRVTKDCTGREGGGLKLTKERNCRAEGRANPR